MTRYRKKPVEIDAFQFRGVSAPLGYQLNLDDWLVDMGGLEAGVKYVGDTIEIPTLEGTMVASPGDWIIRGVKGEFYPCKPDVFDITYEKV